MLGCGWRGCGLAAVAISYELGFEVFLPSMERGCLCDAE